MRFVLFITPLRIRIVISYYSHTIIIQLSDLVLNHRQSNITILNANHKNAKRVHNDQFPTTFQKDKALNPKYFSFGFLPLASKTPFK